MLLLQMDRLSQRGQVTERNIIHNQSSGTVTDVNHFMKGCKDYITSQRPQIDYIKTCLTKN